MVSEPIIQDSDIPNLPQGQSWVFLNRAGVKMCDRVTHDATIGMLPCELEEWNSYFAKHAANPNPLDVTNVEFEESKAA